MAPVQTKAGSNNASAASFSQTFAAAVGSGNCIFGIASFDSSGGANISTITDDKGNSYTVLDNVNDATNGQRAVSFVRGNITNGPVTITITPTVSTSHYSVSMDEYGSILAATDPTDGHTGQLQASTSAPDSGNITTTVNGDVIVGATCCTGQLGPVTYNAGSTYTLEANTNVSGDVATATEDRTQATAASGTHADWSTGSSAWISFVAALKPAASGSNLVAPIQTPSLIFTRIGSPRGNRFQPAFVLIDTALTIPQGNLQLSSVAPSVNFNIVVPQGNLALSSVAASVSASIPTLGSASSLFAPGLSPLDRFKPSLAFPAVALNFTVFQGNLFLSSVAPSVQAGAGSNITPSQGNLVISSVKPDVVQSVTAGQLVLSPTAPTASVGTNISIPQGNLVLSEVAPSVMQSVTAGQLVISTTAPSLGVAVPQGNLVISSVQPLAGVGTTRQPPQGNLVLSPTAPSIGVAVPQGNLVLSQTAPSLDRGFKPAQGNLALSSIAPAVSQGTMLQPAASQLVISTTPIATIFTVPSGNLVLSPTAPSAGGAVNRVPPQGNLVLSTSQPATVIPRRDLVLSSAAPTVFTTDPHPIIVPRSDLVLSSLPPQLLPGVYFYPDHRDFALSSLAPALTHGKLYHWRRKHTASGSIDNDHTLQGSANQEVELEGD